MKHLILIFTFSLIVNPFLAQPENNKESVPPIWLILDGSGSMWGQIDGDTKIAIARTVVKDLLTDMEEDRPVGLVAYGHRKKGDCDDIEDLVAPGVGNHDQINHALKNINPVGKTPLANTALKVIESIKESGDKATVILVSDGAESCGGDLCAVIKAAREAGVDFVLHIVGFDIGESDKLALECAAREGGGIYLDAENSEELSEALEQATELTIDVTDATLSVKVTKDGKLHDAIIKVFNEDKSDYLYSDRTYDSEGSNPKIMHIPSGSYHLKIESVRTDVDPVWVNDVIIEPDSVKSYEVSLDAGKISIRTTANGEPWDCVVSITRPNETRSVAGGRTYTGASSNPMIKELSPGTYDVKISAMKLKGEETVKYFKGVQIAGGETIDLAHDFVYGELSIHATNNGALWDCVINVFKAGDSKQKSVAGGRTYNTASHNPFSHLFTPGRYSVHYKAHHIHGEKWEHIIEDVEVKQGEIYNASHDFVTGIARLGATHNGNAQTCDYQFYINGKRVYNKRISDSKSPLDIVVTPGTYQVIASPAKIDAADQKFEMTIKAGETFSRTSAF